MSVLRSVLLGTVLTLYLLFGGSVFMVIEQGNEIQQHEQLTILKNDIQEILLSLDQDFYNNGTPAEVLEALRQAKLGVISRISDTCGGTNLLDVNSTTTVLRWTFFNSVFYAFTAVTTIGYGNLAPATHWSRMFTIFYALIGIPINGVILTKISDMYSRKLVKVHDRAKDSDSQITFIFNIIFYLIPGLLVFIIIPAAFFVVLENWGYLDAIYFCFVSLTTIGFGDYVAGMGDGRSLWMWLYKIAIVFWIVFGLGYLVMILGFITKGITSKKVRTVLEKKLNRLRITKEKLDNDVEYMRKVVNELYLANNEPDVGVYLTTQNSHQSLEHYLTTYQDKIKRSKSFLVPSGSIPGVAVDMSLIRSFSESDLGRFSRSQSVVGDIGRIDKDAYLAQLVESLEGDISDVLDAVQDLNNFGAEQNNDQSRPAKKISSSQPVDIPHRERLESLRPNDSQILLNNNLEEIVIHKVDSSNKIGILDRVTGAIRKISKSSSGPPSRKISKNEAENRSGKVSCDGSPMIPNAQKYPYQAIFSEATRCSCRSDRCNCGNSSLENSCSTSSSHGDHGYGSPSDPRSSEFRNSRRGFSKTGHRGGKNASIDPHSLAEILKVLDEVQERIYEGDYFPSEPPVQEEVEAGSGSTNFGFVGSTETSPVAGRRRRDAVRNRRVGIFNPDFQYSNPDLKGSAAEKR